MRSPRQLAPASLMLVIQGLAAAPSGLAPSCQLSGNSAPGPAPHSLDEQAVGELHDVGLVHRGHLLAAVLLGVVERKLGHAGGGGAGDDLQVNKGVKQVQSSWKASVLEQ